MAITVTVGAGNTMRPYRRCDVRHFPETATQTFIVGDVLIFDNASGKEFKVKKAGTDPTNIVGVAAEAASGVEGTMVAVYVADEKAEFKANLVDTQVLATTSIGSKFGITIDNTNKIWRVDNTKTSNTRVVITDVDHLAADGTWGDTNATVVFRFLNTFGGSGNRTPFTE
jgi:4-hydroxyphenylpyruvate dioxygenase-like putative hemolysin